MATAQEVIDRVKRIFGDESAVQITDTDIIRWINDAQREVVMHNETVLQKIDTIDTVEEQDEYPFPTDLLVLRSMRYKDDEMESYSKVAFKNLQEFDEFINGWDGTFYPARKPVVYTTYDDTIFLFPRPDKSTTDGLKVLYSKRPVDVTAGLDTLSLPLEYMNAIVKYALTRAYELDEDYESSGIQFAQFQTDVGVLAFRESSEGHQEYYPTITPRLDDVL